MAIIGNIRKRSGLLVIIVGIALAAFVLGDFLKPGGNSRQMNFIGMVDGENIPYTEFAKKVDEQIENTKQRAQKDKLTPDEVFSARQMTWNQMVRDLIMGEQYEKLGISVSQDELFDLVQGKSPHPYILQYFMDPNTQQYNPQMVLNFLKQLDQAEPEQKKNWLLLEKAIKDDRLQTKYNNLLSKGFYIPKAFAQQDYLDKNRRFDVRLVAANFQTVDDKSITLTDEDYKKYYEAHKHEYDQEATRDLEYVLFDILPSEEDRKKIDEDVTLTFNEFQQANDVPGLVNAVSDLKYDSSWRKSGTLSPQIDSAVFNSPAGTFIPPYIENNAYRMAKVMEIQARPDSMMASHILISYQGSAVNDEKITRSKDKAKQIADSLFALVKTDINRFPGIAQTISDDASNKDKGGDLGWFTDGMMVWPFNEAVVKSNPGELRLVETVFGFHIIRTVDKKAAVRKVRVAIIERRIEPSSKTIQDIYAQASEFAGDNTNIEAFTKASEAKGLNKRVADMVRAMDNNLPGLNGSRMIIQWAFGEDVKKGNVSGVFELEAKYYVIAALKEARAKGIPTLDQLKTTIEPLVRRDKKAEKLMETFKAAGTKDLYQLAAKINSKVDTVNDVVFFSGNLPKYGPEPEVIGTIYTLKPGSTTEPMKGSMGIYVITLDNIKEAPETKEYTMNVQQLQYGFINRVQGQAYQTLEKMSEIEDNRVRFY